MHNDDDHRRARDAVATRIVEHSKREKEAGLRDKPITRETATEIATNVAIRNERKGR